MIHHIVKKVPGAAIITRRLSTVPIHDFYADSKIQPMLAPVSTATDIVNDRVSPTCVMRMGLHHLHANRDRFLPTTLSSDQQVNLHCVSQACVTYPVDQLADKVRTGKDSINLRGMQVGYTSLISEMWVESLGRTSITFGHAISHHDDLLALVTRVFCRQDASTGNLLYITEDERSETFPASYDYNVVLPTVDKVTESQQQDLKKDDEEEVMQVRIGPHHCIDGKVADPAALADIALHSLFLKGFSHDDKKVSIQYRQPACLNQTMSCRIVGSEPVVRLYGNYPSGDDELIALASLQHSEKNI